MDKSNKVFIINTEDEFNLICKMYPGVNYCVDHEYCLMLIRANISIYIREEDSVDEDMYCFKSFDGKIYLSNAFSEGEYDIDYFDYMYDYDYELIYACDICNDSIADDCWDISNLT